MPQRTPNGPLYALWVVPNHHFVIVARENSLLNLAIPDNVTSFTNLALAKTMNILQNAKIAVVPLRTNRTPCGHVTIMASMHLGKAQVVTRSEGVADYIEDGKTGAQEFCAESTTVRYFDSKVMALHTVPH